jgi:hypothetical protein
MMAAVIGCVHLLCVAVQACCTHQVHCCNALVGEQAAGLATF